MQRIETVTFEALKRGLANLDEQAVAALGFERLILLRSAQKPKDARLASAGERLAAWMLSITRFMVPPSEQPVTPISRLCAATCERSRKD